MARRGRQYTAADRRRLAHEAWSMGPKGAKIVGRREGIPRSTLYVWQVEFGLRRVPDRTHVPHVRMGLDRNATTTGGSTVLSDQSWDANHTTTTSGAHQKVTFSSEPVEEQTFAGEDNWSISIKGCQVRTFDQLVAHCKVDLKLWESVEFKVRSYQSAMRPWATGSSDAGWKREGDEPVTVQMYAVTASFKRKKALISARSEIEVMLAELKADARAVPPAVIHRAPKSGYLLELSLCDTHFGKLAWQEETGGPAYDLEVATRVFHQAADMLLERAGHMSFERILWVVGNDALHIDGDSKATTKGTPQDVDGRPAKVFRATRQAHCALGDRLRAVAPLQIEVIKGNHDGASALMLGDALECWFHNDPHVSVDASPLARKYVEHGHCLIGLTHGDAGKPEMWSRLMPVDAPEQWGRTVYREMHAGHRHKDYAYRDEINGVKVRMLPSLAPPDAWHASQGFVGNQPSSEALFWHAEEGVIGSAVYTHRYVE